MLADGPTILNYVKMTADKYNITQHVRLSHFCKSASWSDETSRWTLCIEKLNAVTGVKDTIYMSCQFLFMCTGYYDYDKGYSPSFPGSERFKGPIIHPQHWPKDLDYTNKRVVVIGSGATAITLVPAMSDKVSHITMLQRSPTYVASLPANDPVADLCLRILPVSVAHFINRWKNIILGRIFYWYCRAFPVTMKNVIVGEVTKYLGKEYEKHFSPNYKPWDQRFCVVPEGDLFKAIKNKKASVVTDTIKTFTETGIKVNGTDEEIPADIIITATGLTLKLCGGMKVFVNGNEITDVSNRYTYKGVMVSGIPNLALFIGYTNASFTLRVDLIGDYIIRLQKYMEAKGYKKCAAVFDNGGDENEFREPMLDLSSGYVQRSIHLMPSQGRYYPWKYYQNYFYDLFVFRFGGLNDGVLQFSK